MENTFVSKEEQIFCPNCKRILYIPKSDFKLSLEYQERYELLLKDFVKLRDFLKGISIEKILEK